jgi:hypothetical protein
MPRRARAPTAGAAGRPWAGSPRLYLSPLADHPLNSISRADVEDVIASTNSPCRANHVAKVLRMILGPRRQGGKDRDEPRERDRVAEDRAPGAADPVP